MKEKFPFPVLTFPLMHMWTSHLIFLQEINDHARNFVSRILSEELNDLFRHDPRS